MALYQYPDGTQGSTPYQMGADGQYVRQGSGLIEGSMVYGQPGSGYAAGTELSAMGQGPATNQWATSGFGQPQGGGAVFGGTSPSAGGGMKFTGGPSPAPIQSTGGAGGMSGGSYMDQTNPYLQKQMDAVTKTMTDNFNTRVQPQIASNAMAAGGYGGSRQGVLEANAHNDLQANIGNALAGLGGNAFGQQLQYDLGRRADNLGQGNLGLGYYNAANNYNLGLGSQNLGYANLDRQINNDNNQWALQGAQLGNNTWNQLNNNNLTGLNAGNTIQNTPLDYWNKFANGANGMGNGFGTSTGTTNVQGNPMLGALGGAQLAGQIGNLWGGGGGGGWGSMPNSGVYFGNGGMGD